jgi:hypothetical protein
MKPINFGRVILGGLLAGVIINISEFLLHAVVLKKDLEDAMRSLNRTTPMGGGQFAVWILFGFVVGIAAVWLYAAIRPRYGPGPGTAVRAGVTVWFFQSLLPSIAMANLGLFEGKLVIVPVIWVLVEQIIATNAGAWLYKEEGTAAT